MVFVIMTSLMTSQRDDKVSLLYSCLNEIVTFFTIIQWCHTFLNFNSRQTVGVAGDDIMYYILVCLCVCGGLCHDVCPDDLTIKEWCHIHNILQEHSWGCLVVQVMCDVFMTSSMTSWDRKVGQILKLP